MCLKVKDVKNSYARRDQEMLTPARFSHSLGQEACERDGLRCIRTLSKLLYLQFRQDCALSVPEAPVFVEAIA